MVCVTQDRKHRYVMVCVTPYLSTCDNGTAWSVTPYLSTCDNGTAWSVSPRTSVLVTTVRHGLCHSVPGIFCVSLYLKQRYGIVCVTLYLKQRYGIVCVTLYLKQR